MLRTLFVFGTRPEAIKLAPVIRELRNRRRSFRVSICVTAQHRNLLDQVLEVFQLRPDYDLDIMKDRQDLFHLTTSTLQRIRPVLNREQPDLVVVQGDTSTAFAAALSAFYSGIPVAHIEAGLRTYDLQRPFPEELNRRLIAPIAQFNFAPTRTARLNLLAERIPAETICVTGNTVIDALLDVARRTSIYDLRSTIPNRQSSIVNRQSPSGRLILVTAHRRENFGRPLQNICRALLQIVKAEPDVTIAYPVHPNPNVHETVNRLLGDVPQIRLLPPLDYLSFVQLLKRSYIVISDSGGIQEEAPALGKPVLVLRETTERPEALRAGTARLVGTDPRHIVPAALRLLRSAKFYRSMAAATNPFGDGHAAKRIADFLEFRNGKRRNRPVEFRGT